VCRAITSASPAPTRRCSHGWTSLLDLGLPYSADPALVALLELRVTALWEALELGREYFWEARGVESGDPPAGQEGSGCQEAEGALRRSRCGHWFHEPCIHQWFDQGPAAAQPHGRCMETCPTCQWRWREGHVPKRGGA
jgi:hypothetical protein